jgi:hypothetical protein
MGQEINGNDVPRGPVILASRMSEVTQNVLWPAYFQEIHPAAAEVPPLPAYMMVEHSPCPPAYHLQSESITA